MNHHLTHNFIELEEIYVFGSRKNFRENYEGPLNFIICLKYIHV